MKSQSKVKSVKKSYRKLCTRHCHVATNVTSALLSIKSVSCYSNYGLCMMTSDHNRPQYRQVLGYDSVLFVRAGATSWSSGVCGESVLAVSSQNCPRSVESSTQLHVLTSTSLVLKVPGNPRCCVADHPTGRYASGEVVTTQFANSLPLITVLLAKIVERAKLLVLNLHA